MKYHRKPDTVEAIQYGRRFDWPDWFHDAVSDNTVKVFGTGKFADPTEPCYCIVETFVGAIRCEEGDYVVFADGSIHPSPKRTFELLYEPVPT